jgi:hypothetical protein
MSASVQAERCGYSEFCTDFCLESARQIGKLDCGNVLYTRFTVLPPDTRSFEGDHDGIGCEK